ncbi:MAG: glutaredoxin 3 [Candidatus Parabeggiatoa sp. nov. 3]|nr:MAG: glutaredoxin 3 [Gammaproteobacteria bacterium]RKZ59045.1 MAG: glutaredoxin 3 [Gammaproteobacteria bacterium]RKZ82136.1 MAG: glutaredoxin 3 [Gammaproteobacteria bacterium]
MPIVRMYSTLICPYCMRAEGLLNKKGVQVEKILVKNEQEMINMAEITGRRTVPQIFIGERHVGGFDDLVELDMAGELDPLLAP